MDQGEGDHSDSSSDEDSPQPAGLKRGRWTAEEDEILREHMQKHRTGNWDSVSRLSGLARSGKSCRMRWINHLHPDLKKGKMSPEEQEKIILLHSQMGNKWSKIAKQIKGRTDNEIKNFWNNWLKKCMRYETPIYPSHICPQAIAAIPNEDNGSGISHTNEQTRKEGTSIDAGSAVIPCVVVDRLDPANINPTFPHLRDLLGPAFGRGGLPRFSSPLAPVQLRVGGTIGVQGVSNGDNVSGQPPETMELTSIQSGGGNFFALSTSPPLVSSGSIELPLEAMGNITAPLPLVSAGMIRELPSWAMSNQVFADGDCNSNVTAPPRRVSSVMIQELLPGSMSNQVVTVGDCNSNVTAPPRRVSPVMIQELLPGSMSNEVVAVGDCNSNVTAPPRRVSSVMIRELLPGSMSNQVDAVGDCNSNVTAPPQRVSPVMIQELLPGSMSNQVVAVGDCNSNVTAPPRRVSPVMIQELLPGSMSNQVVAVGDGNSNVTAPPQRVSPVVIQELLPGSMSNQVVADGDCNSNVNAPPRRVSPVMIQELLPGSMSNQVAADGDCNSNVTAPPRRVSPVMIQELLPGSMSNQVVPVHDFNSNVTAPPPHMSAEMKDRQETAPNKQAKR